MLGNINQEQKTRNDLVFKLLKSMNPYIGNLDQNNKIRDKLYQIIKQQTSSNIIPQQQQQSQHSLDLSHSRIHQHLNNQAKNIVSRVVDVHVLDGMWLGEEVKGEMEAILMRELEIQRRSQMVRSEIRTIQDNTYKTFKIAKQTKQATSPYSHSSYRSNLAGKLTRYQPYQISKMPTSRSVMTSAYFSNNNNIQNNNSSIFQINESSGRSRFSSSHNTYAGNAASQLVQLRCGLSKLDSPQKSYRHQTDQLKNNYMSLQPFRKQQYNSEIRREDSNMQLGLESQIKGSKIHRSKSSITMRQQKKGKISAHTKQKELKLSNKVKAKQYEHNGLPKTTSRSIILQNKWMVRPQISQKVLKQAQVLDVDIVASILSRKINSRDKTNTIASLIT